MGGSALRRNKVWHYFLIIYPILILTVTGLPEESLKSLNQLIEKITHLNKPISSKVALHTFILVSNVIICTALLLRIERKGIKFGGFLSKIISGSVNSVLGVYTIIVFLITFSIFQNKLEIFIDSHDWNVFYLSVIYLLTGINTSFLFMLSQSHFYRQVSKQDNKPQKKKVLIVALSRFYYDRKDREKNINEFLNEIANKQLDKSKYSWAVPLRSVKHHSDGKDPILEKVIILVSDETSSNPKVNSNTYNFNDFRKVWREFCKHYGVNIGDPIESNPVKFDDLKSCLRELDRLIHEEVFPEYKDEDISMNISSGTAVVSAAMVIASVKEGRQIEYIEQKEREIKELVGINVSVEDIYNFYPELRG